MWGDFDEQGNIRGYRSVDDIRLLTGQASSSSTIFFFSAALL
ncbi:hypothetical protein [Bacillus sp. 2205SS5-2]